MSVGIPDRFESYLESNPTPMIHHIRRWLLNSELGPGTQISNTLCCARYQNKEPQKIRYFYSAATSITLLKEGPKMCYPEESGTFPRYEKSGGYKILARKSSKGKMISIVKGSLSFI